MQTKKPASEKMKNEGEEVEKWIGSFYSLFNLIINYSIPGKVTFFFNGKKPINLNWKVLLLTNSPLYILHGLYHWQFQYKQPKLYFY